jgi:Mechanosensitive ion channel
VAIGFAFQNILQNFLAGLLLLWSEPFRVGDEIKIDPYEGAVDRLIKYVSILIPDPGPFGETFRDARVRAIVVALLLNNPLGGCVESVVTLDTPSSGFLLGWHSFSSAN